MRTRFRMYGTARICHLDFTNVTDEAEATALAEEAKRVIGAEPLKSVYTLTDVSNSVVTPRIRKALLDLTSHNTPYVIAGAVVGLTAVQKGVLNTIVRMTGRKLVVAETIEDAVRWLTAEMTAANSDT